MNQTTYVRLLECYRSGQIPERDWQDLQRDEVFRAWLKQHQ